MRAAPEQRPELLIARVAGLPASWIDCFGGEEHLRLLRALEAVEQDLATARAALGERLYEAAGPAPPPLRRFLLAVKRDCFNGRSLRPHRAAPEWEELRVRAGPAADRVLALEERAEGLQRDFERAWSQVRESEMAHLRALSVHPGLRRALALAAPELFASLPRLEGPPAAWGRREKRACLSLLRYGSRAALKLSPYSTLTRLALTRMSEDAAAPVLRLLGDPDARREISLVRLRRYLVQQLAALVLRSPAFHDSVPVRLNPSLVEGRPGHVRFVRPAGWEVPENGGPACYQPPVLREVPVDSALVEWLRGPLLEGGSLPRLREALDEIPGTRPGAVLRRLAKLGLLFPVPPWPIHDPRLEEGMAACLLQLPEEAGLAGVAGPLARLVALENGFAAAVDPAGVAQEIERCFGEAWRAALAAAGLAAGITPSRGKRNELYEDVFLLGGGGGPEELVEVSATRLNEVVRSVEPWFRLVDLHAPRYEALLTFAALARSRWPGRDEVGALELFQEVRPWWREILGEKAGFDPLELPEIAELRRLRRSIRSELPRILEEDGEASRISAGALQALLEALPPHYRPAVGPCLFLQPADAAGELWVLNRIFEGTGRYASRFTPALPDGLRRRFIDPLLSSEVELLDLVSGQGDTLNVHAVQTRRVLTLPGEPMALEPGREIDASTLRVRLDGPLPVLVDGEGRPLLPVHLGAAALAYMPPLIVFLALFGPGELRPIPVPQRVRPVGDIRIHERVVLGRVVLARRRWIVPVASAAACFELPPPQAFAALDRWRCARGLPERVFAIERVVFQGVAGEVFKPQYLDFTSPSFCSLFEAILRTSGETLVLEEVLPAADAFPRGADGERWAVELQADTLGLSRSP